MSIDRLPAPYQKPPLHSREAFIYGKAVITAENFDILLHPNKQRYQQYDRNRGAYEAYLPNYDAMRDVAQTIDQKAAWIANDINDICKRADFDNTLALRDYIVHITNAVEAKEPAEERIYANDVLPAPEEWLDMFEGTRGPKKINTEKLAKWLEQKLQPAA